VKLTGPRPFPGAPPSTWPAGWPSAGSVSWTADELPPHCGSRDGRRPRLPGRYSL